MESRHTKRSLRRNHQDKTRQGREGREEATMIDRERASVEEGRVEGGRVDEGNERGRDGRGMDGGTEEASGGGLNEEGMEKGSKGGRKTSREYPEEGTGQYTVYSQPSHNEALAI